MRFPNLDYNIYIGFFTSPTIDVLHKLATIFIALFNLGFAIYIFFYKDKKDNKDKVEKHNVDLYKELILKPNVTSFYHFVDTIEEISFEFKQPQQTVEKKQEVKEKIDDEFSKLRRKFIDNIGAIDNNLRESTQKLCDDLQDYFSEIIFDSNIDLSNKQLLNDTFISKLQYFKTDVLKKLITYRG